MLELLVVRHGQSMADLEKRMEGRADFPLSELGREQAGYLARWIRENRTPDMLISSPLKRAAETAQIVANENGIEVQYEDDLMEWNHGVLAGLLKTEADILYPVPAGGRKIHDVIESGESLIALRARAETFMSKLIHSDVPESPTRKRICIVSHGLMITNLFRAFLQLPVDSNINLHTYDTGVHIWGIAGSENRIIVTNSQVHLHFKWKIG